jgi:hypothetical protein
MGMMTLAVQYAKESKKNFFYMGSAQRPTDTYKFQFRGMEWFDGAAWHSNFDVLKEALKK